MWTSAKGKVDCWKNSVPSGASYWLSNPARRVAYAGAESRIGGEFSQLAPHFQWKLRGVIVALSLLYVGGAWEYAGPSSRPRLRSRERRYANATNSRQGSAPVLSHYTGFLFISLSLLFQPVLNYPREGRTRLRSVHNFRCSAAHTLPGFACGHRPRIMCPPCASGQSSRRDWPAAPSPDRSLWTGHNVMTTKTKRVIQATAGRGQGRWACTRGVEAIPLPLSSSRRSSSRGLPPSPPPCSPPLRLFSVINSDEQWGLVCLRARSLVI